MNAPDDHPPSDDQLSAVVGGATSPAPPPASEVPPPMVGSRVEEPGTPTAPDDQASDDAQVGLVVGGAPSPAPPPAIPRSKPTADARVEEYGKRTAPLLGLAETLNDVEQLRIATTHRIGALQRSGGGTDDEIRQQQLVADGLETVEKMVTKQLEKAMKAHPLGPWIEATHGVGLKQGARLIAAVGNPWWNAAANRPRRGPAELWAYTGYHVLPAAGQTPVESQERHAGGGHPLHPTNQRPPDDHRSPVGGVAPLPAAGHRAIGSHSPTAGGGHPLHPTDHAGLDTYGSSVGGVAPRRRKGQHANWNDAARMRVRLVAEACLKAKAKSPYGKVYDAGREKYADAAHCAPCAQCGPAGKPAQPGSPLSNGHQHARALRLVAKEILKDLFLEAKRWHEEAPESS